MGVSHFGDRRLKCCLAGGAHECLCSLGQAQYLRDVCLKLSWQASGAMNGDIQANRELLTEPREAYWGLYRLHARASGNFPR